MDALKPPLENHQQFGLGSSREKGLSCSQAKNSFQESHKEAEWCTELW